MLEHAYDKMEIILVGNKADLDNQRQVSREEGEAFARENNLLFQETSAKNAFNVESTFEDASSIILQKINQGEYDLSNESIGIKPGNVAHPRGAGNKKLRQEGTNNKDASGGCCWISIYS